MGIHVGLDIGAASLKLAVIGDRSEQDRFATLLKDGSTFFAAQFPAQSPRTGLPLLLSRYRRIRGTPAQAASELLHDLLVAVPEDSITGFCVTGSGGKLVADTLSAASENEFRAIAKAVREFHPEVRTVFEMGGEASRYLLLDGKEDSQNLGILDYQLSGDCAAGTGSFLDQQASRLLYSIEQVGPAACSASCAARVAGRCSVFAKTDMIHAQQKGYSTGQILKGLCEAVARNYKSSILKGRRIIPPVAFIGGVALNQAVRDGLRALMKLNEQELFVPELACWLGALGAALFAFERGRGLGRPIHSLAQLASGKADYASVPPLSMKNVARLHDQAGIPSLHGRKVEAYLGIDIGSVSTNLVVLDQHASLLKEIYLPTQGRPIDVVNQGLEDIAAELGDALEIRGVGTTGSGRELIGELVGADTVNDEITAHKTGAMHVCRRLGIEDVDTIFEIGGQDSKFIRIDHGIVVDFTMNEACAAGTGSFLEEQAEKLGISIKEEFARLALASSAPARLGERCTVFMEREVTGLLLKGVPVGDLCAGLAYSVALNYLNRVVRGRKIGDVIFFQGGTAYNDAVAAAFSEILGRKIIVPPHNGVMGAIGMALLAKERMQGSSRRTRFRGYSLHHVNYTSRDFVCRACSNFCDMKEFVIEGQKTYWGDKCSDKFRKRTRSERQPVIDDLVSYREQLLAAGLQPAEGKPTVGVPRAMFYFDRFPFWCAFLQELEYGVVPSPATDGRIAMAGEELAIAQPCFPVQVAHGHVEKLLKMGVDYIFLPNVLNYETPFSQSQSHLCPWNQTLPFVVQSVIRFEKVRERFLTPTVHFRLGRNQVEKELEEFAARLGKNRKTTRRAVHAAYSAQDSFQQALLKAGERALKRLERTGEPGLVLLGRAYNLYDSGVNCDIPRKLRSLYGVNIIPLDFLPLDREDISGVNPNMYWNSGRLILAAAQITRRHRNLHLAYISNFKCGPDSYIKSFLPDAARKPALFLQFDGHSNDAGFITRCEAYLDSKGFLRCPSANTAA